MCKRGCGYLDFGDMPATKGLYKGAGRVISGSILGVKMSMEKKIKHMFNLGEGLHHAKENKASGFCVFNDIVIVGKFLQKENGIKRIVTIDIDGDHGVGTQEIL